MAFVLEKDKENNTVVIDRERGAILKNDNARNNSREHYCGFEFIYDGECTKVGAYWQDDDSTFSWKLGHVHVPESIGSQKSEILSMLEEALVAYGAFGSQPGNQKMKTIVPHNGPAEWVP